MDQWTTSRSIWNHQGIGSDMEGVELDEKTHSPPPTRPTVLASEDLFKLPWGPAPGIWGNEPSPMSRKRQRSVGESATESHIAILSPEGYIICPKCGEELEPPEDESEESEEPFEDDWLSDLDLEESLA